MLDKGTVSDLIQSIADMKDEASDLDKRIFNAESVLRDYMEDIGASVIAEHPEYEVSLAKGSPKTDTDKIQAIWALAEKRGISPEMMAKAYTPARMVEVPAKWNRTYLKPLAKYGDDVAEVIEDSAIYGTATIKIIERKKDN